MDSFCREPFTYTFAKEGTYPLYLPVPFLDEGNRHRREVGRWVQNAFAFGVGGRGGKPTQS